MCLPMRAINIFVMYHNLNIEIYIKINFLFNSVTIHFHLFTIRFDNINMYYIFLINLSFFDKI